MTIKEIIKALRRGLFSNTLLSVAADELERLESKLDFEISARNLAEATSKKYKSELELVKALHKEAIAERDLANIRLTRAETVIEDLRHEIRNLECEKGQLEGTNEYLIEQAKIEGFKELAKRLKDHYIKNRIYHRPNAHTLIGYLFCQIDNLVKEREGETK